MWNEIPPFESSSAFFYYKYLYIFNQELIMQGIEQRTKKS